MSFAARAGSYYKGGVDFYFSNAAVVSISEQDLAIKLDAAIALSGASLNLLQGDVSLPVALTPAEVNITPQDLNQSFLYTAQMTAESITLTTNDLFWRGEFNAHLETVDLSIPSYPLDFTQNWSFVSYGTEESWQQIDYGESV